MLTGVDVDTFDDQALLDYANQALENGLWDGRPVTWETMPSLQSKIKHHLVYQLGAMDPDRVDSQQMALRIAWIGADLENKAILFRELKEIDNGHYVLVSHHHHKKKSFWEKHRTEILIGVGIIALVTAVAIVALCTAGSGSGAVAAAGGSLLNQGLNDEGKKEGKSNGVPEATKASSLPLSPASSQPLSQAPSLPVEPSCLPGQTLFLEKAVYMNGQYFSYTEMLKKARQEELLSSILSKPTVSSAESMPHAPSLPENPMSIPAPQPQNALATRLHKAGSDGPLHGASLGEPFSPPKTSSHFATSGIKRPDCQIMGINGMNTSFSQAMDHAEYLKSFTPEQSISWVYNHSNSPAVDLAEVFTLNYLGCSPNTEKLLLEQWTAFHNDKRSNENVKVLQFCHSQGAIHVRNTLATAPKEVRNRVIVVAIAPAAVVTDDLCHQSFNYASKKDIVPFGELVFASSLDSNEYGTSKIVEQALDNREQLILLEPHSDAVGIDHDFQSPTFREVIKKHVDKHLNCKGEYIGDDK